MNEAAISNAYDATKVFFQTPQERMDYLNRQMAIMDYNYGLQSAEERGEQRGEQRMRELIRLLKNKGGKASFLKLRENQRCCKSSIANSI